jgi:hypothetical protein
MSYLELIERFRLLGAHEFLILGVSFVLGAASFRKSYFW